MRNLASIANTVMPPPVHEDRIWKQDGHTDDIVDAILSAEQWNQSQTAALAPYLKGGSTSETLRNVWFFIRSNIRYKKDAPGYERVKLPAKTWADREGDCKSMSVFIAGLLKSLGIPAKYRFVSYRKGEPVTHVYVIATPKGQRPVILDAVHSKFDTEEPYSYKREYPIMTKVAVIHGLPGGTPQDDKPRKLAPWQNIFWGKLTEGEMRLALIGQQIDIVKDWYGDSTGQLANSVTAIQNTLYQGVHGIGTGAIPGNILPVVAQAINSARWQMKPAGSHFTSMRDPRKEGLVPDYIGMPDKEFEQVMKDFLGTGECAQPLEYAELEDPYGNVIPGQYDYTQPGMNEALRVIPALAAQKKMTSAQRVALTKACRDQIKIVEIYNSKLKKGAHHVLYNFVKDTKVVPTEVVNKTLGHRQTKEKLAIDISGLSYENMDLFLRNSVMHTNGQEGQGKLDPMSPEDTIKMMIAGQQEGINAIALAALVPILLKVIEAATALLVAIKQLLPPKDQIALNQINGLGTPSFGPQSYDWEGYNPDTVVGPGGSPVIKNDPTVAKAGMNWIFPVLIGGGLLLGAKSLK